MNIFITKYSKGIIYFYLINTTNHSFIEDSNYTKMRRLLKKNRQDLLIENLEKIVSILAFFYFCKIMRLIP